MRPVAALAACLLLLGATAASAEYYTWVDGEGTKHFTDSFGTIPPEFRHTVNIRNPDPGREQWDKASATPARSSGSAAVTPAAAIGPASASAPLAREPDEEPTARRWFKWAAIGLGVLVVVGALAGWAARRGNGNVAAMDGNVAPMDGMEGMEGAEECVVEGDDGPLAQLLGLVLAFAVLNGALWGFGQWAAPMIWKGEDDQYCQEDGYWYATGSGEDALCERWYLIPIPRLRR